MPVLDPFPLRTVVLLLATITMGLSAGLFATFSYAVMPGLRPTDDRTFVAAMQSINVKILNVWFAICFVGPIILTALAIPLHLGPAGRPQLPWLVIALVLYLVTLVITFRISVPLNNALAAAGDPDQIDDLASVRRRFEAPWVRWNVVRSISTTVAFAVLAVALLASP
jgi:uncharacterized membrane protein